MSTGLLVGRLAVITAQLGTVSETFIRRHVEDLLPTQTVVVARASATPRSERWQAPCPVFFIDREAQSLRGRFARRVGSASALPTAAITRFLRKHGVRIVLGEYLDQFVDFIPLLNRLRLPYVVQGHGLDLSAALRQPGMAERYGAFASARAILTRSEFHRRRLIDIGLPAERVAVNAGGVDVPDHVPERGLETAKRLLAIGRMTPKKGPIYLLAAFRQAAEQDPNLHLDYVGDGELFSAVRQFVEAMGLGSRVRLHGAAPEDVKLRLLRDCGIFVQHSITDPVSGDEEGLPAAIQEAMAYGLAVVSTRHSGIPEAVEHGVNGLLAEERDVAAMANNILRASRGDSAVRLGLAGRAKAKADFSWDAERSRLLTYLQH